MCLWGEWYLIGVVVVGGGGGGVANKAISPKSAWSTGTEAGIRVLGCRSSQARSTRGWFGEDGRGKTSNFTILDRVRIWYRGYIYAEQKINKNKHKNKKTKRRSEFSGSFGKRRRREKKRKKEMKEENEGGKWKWRRDLVMLCGLTASPGLIMRTVFTVNMLDLIWRDSSLQPAPSTLIQLYSI